MTAHRNFVVRPFAHAVAVVGVLGWADEEFFEFIDEPRSAFTDALYDQIVGACGVATPAGVARVEGCVAAAGR